MSQISSHPLSNAPRPAITDLSGGRGALDRTSRMSMRTRTYTARTMTECLQMAKQELGVEAMIVSKKTFRQGAIFGRWGGREMVEVTFGTYRPSAAVDMPSSITFSHGNADDEKEADVAASATISKLEAQIAGLTESVQNLMDSGAPKTKKASDAFVASPIEVRAFNGATDAIPAPPTPSPKVPRRSRAKAAGEAVQKEEAGHYPLLVQQLLDAEVAAPVARQLLEDVPAGLSTADAVSALRTSIAHRLRIANRVRPEIGGGMRLLAFIGTTGVGKSTTIAKLAAQYSIMERRRVGVITLDTHRVAAVQQLQTFGQILKVPVQVAHDKTELMQHLNDFKAQGMELVLVDTAGRSPNDMMPLGEVCDMLDGMGSVQKYLAIPATLAARDMENIVTRFQSILNPDALVLTKLDEATDNACFGKLLTIQAKTGLPLAYVTTGQKVPDDITFPDAHAIAARILTTAVL